MVGTGGAVLDALWRPMAAKSKIGAALRRDEDRRHEAAANGDRGEATGGAGEHWI